MLIAFAGIDGSGKSTQIDLLKKFLSKKGYPVVISKACGDKEKKSLSRFFKYWDDSAITFLFQGLHRQQYIDAKKNLCEGKIVLADRWDETYLSYHRCFGFLSEDKRLRLKLNSLAFNGLIPDLTFFINISSSEAHRRLASRGKDILDQGSLKYHSRIGKSIRESLRGRSPIIIDGAQGINKIHLIIVTKVLGYLDKNKLSK
jgi:dTMP kinase